MIDFFKLKAFAKLICIDFNSINVPFSINFLVSQKYWFLVIWKINKFQVEQKKVASKSIFFHYEGNFLVEIRINVCDSTSNNNFFFFGIFRFPWNLTSAIQKSKAAGKCTRNTKIFQPAMARNYSIKKYEKYESSKSKLENWKTVFAPHLIGSIKPCLVEKYLCLLL